jgi:hypothetical protein
MKRDVFAGRLHKRWHGFTGSPERATVAHEQPRTRACRWEVVPPSCLHFCDKEQLENLGKALAWCWQYTSDDLPTFLRYGKTKQISL